MHSPPQPLFAHLTAFLSPLVPLDVRLRWTLHGGTLATHSQVDDDDCSIHLWIADYAHRHTDPLVPRCASSSSSSSSSSSTSSTWTHSPPHSALPHSLQALGVILHDSAWITASLASRRLVIPSPFSFAALDLASRQLDQPNLPGPAPAYSPFLSHDTPCATTYWASQHTTPTPTALRSGTTRTHERDTPLTTAARSDKLHDPPATSLKSSATIGTEALSMSDAEVERLLVERNPRSSFLGKLRAAQGAQPDSDSDNDDGQDAEMRPSSTARPQDGMSSSESQFADHEDLLSTHLSTSSGTPPRARSNAASDDSFDSHAEDDAAPGTLAAFFAAPLAEQGGPPVYDADALLALLQRQSAAPREQVERVVHGEGGWTVRRRARGGGARDEG